MQQTEEDEKHARHKCGDGQSFQSVLLNDAVDNNDKRTRWAAYLHLRTAEDANHESGDNGRDDALLG